jgi:polysaccharide export outer membrane protein
VGEINVLGITANQLAKILESKLSFYIIEPKVNVFVTAYNPLKVYVLGAVTNPGALDYKPGDRLTDYITEAGGFNQTADLKKCYIYPKDSTQKETKVNLKKILDKDNPDLDIELKPFDTVYLKQKSGFIFSEWRDIADALSIIVGLFTLYLVISNQR